MKPTIFTLLLLSASALAVPLSLTKRQTITDADILNYALTLEHLEAAFYTEGLSNFSEPAFLSAGYSPEFYANLREIAYDETTHVTFLTSALSAAGIPATAPCSYAFDVTTPQQFVALSSVLEGVGVSAYLGAAADIATAAYLTVAGSILTVEARHNAYIRYNQFPPQSPFPAPFDSPLGLNQVYTLAASFITSCPSTNPALPVKPFPSLSVSPQTTQPVQEKQTITFDVSTPITAGSVHAAFYTVTGPVFAPEVVSTEGGMAFVVTIPHGVTGQSYVVLTSVSSGAVGDAEVLAGPAIVNVEAYYFYEDPTGE